MRSATHDKKQLNQGQRNNTYEISCRARREEGSRWAIAQNTDRRRRLIPHNPTGACWWRSRRDSAADVLSISLSLAVPGQRYSLLPALLVAPHRAPWPLATPCCRSLARRLPANWLENSNSPGHTGRSTNANPKTENKPNKQQRPPTHARPANEPLRFVRDQTARKTTWNKMKNRHLNFSKTVKQRRVCACKEYIPRWIGTYLHAHFF